MLWTEISDRNSIRIKRSRTKSIEMPRIRQRTEISTEARSVEKDLNKNPSQGIIKLIKLLPNFLSLWVSHFLFRLWQEFLKRYWLGSPSSSWWIPKRMSVFRPLNWSSTHVSTRFFCFPAWMRLGSRKPETHTLPKIHAIPCRLVTNCVRQGCEFVASCWSCMCTKHLICSKLL